MRANEIVVGIALLSCLACNASPPPQPQPQPQPAGAAGQSTEDRTVLPIPEPKPADYTELDARNAKAPPRFEVKAPARRAQRAHRADRRHGLRPVEHVRRADPHADAGAAGAGRLRYNKFHTTALCSPTRTALLTGRNHHIVQHGLDHGDRDRVPRQDRAEARTAWRRWPRCCGSTATAPAAFGKSHETAAWEVSASGPTDRWPTRSGFDKFYGFIGGETNQWSPLIYDGMTQVEPPKMANYHFTTDMTNQAIKWIKAQKSLTPDKPFFIYFATGRHARAAPRAEGVDRQVQGQVRPGLGQGPRGDARPPEEARRRPGRHQARAASRRPSRTGTRCRADEQRLFARQMEVFAGFGEYTDHEVGRLVQAIEDLGQMDNTLVLLHRRRQRHERRRRHERPVQRDDLLQRRARDGRGPPPA